MNAVKFEPNQPVRVALAYPNGKSFAGRYGPRVLFSLSAAPAGETQMYLPPIAARQIEMLGIQPGEPIEVVKSVTPNGATAKIEWLINRVPPETKAASPETNVPILETKPSTPETTRRKPVATAPVNGHATAEGIPYYDQKTELIRAYDVAIEVLVEARAHAAVANLPIQFTGEDVRQLAATIIIDQGKSRRMSTMRAA